MKNNGLLGKCLLSASLLVLLSIMSANDSARAQYVGADIGTSAKQSSSLPGKDASVISPTTGGDGTVASGLTTNGTVRVNNLAMLESLVNIGANGVEVISIVWGVALLIAASLKRKGLKQMALAVIPIVLGLEAPNSINWLLSSARDANLFS